MRRPGARFTCCNDTQPASTHRFMSFLWQAARGWPGVEDARTGLHHSPWANPKSGTAGRVLGSADARRCGPPTTHPSAHTARATASPPSAGGAAAWDHVQGQTTRVGAPTAAAGPLASESPMRRHKPRARSFGRHKVGKSGLRLCDHEVRAAFFDIGVGVRGKKSGGKGPDRKPKTRNNELGVWP